MTTPKEVLAIAQREIGYKESPAGSNRNKFGVWYGMNEQPWCAMFVSYCFYQANLPLPIQMSKGFAYCPSGVKWFRDKGQWFKTPQVGDVVFFDWKRDGVSDHVGIVESVNADGTITSIEGNTSVGNDSNGEGVMRRTRTLNVVQGFGRPAYNGISNPPIETDYPVWPGRYIALRTPPFMQGDDVLTWQRQMIKRGWDFGSGGSTGKGDDGVFDERCDEVLREFQRQKRLEIDGVLGAESWKAAWLLPVPGSTSSDTGEDKTAKTGRVNSRVKNQLKLRTQASTDASLISELAPGTTFKVLRPVEGSPYPPDNRTDWYEIEFNGQRGFVAAFFVDIVSDSNGSDPNAILLTYQPKGASDRTANQDGLPQRGITGVKASETMAQADRSRVMPHKDKFEQAARRFDLPPALLAAIASRESRGGSVLDKNGCGDQGNAFGIMQVDKRHHDVVTDDGPSGQSHIDQATKILKDKLEEVKNKFPSLSKSEQLQTAVSRYNGGKRLPAPDSDQETTAGDYMNDVWARAHYYAGQWE